MGFSKIFELRKFIKFHQYLILEYFGYPKKETLYLLSVTLYSPLVSQPIPRQLPIYLVFL